MFLIGEDNNGNPVYIDILKVVYCEKARQWYGLRSSIKAFSLYKFSISVVRQTAKTTALRANSSVLLLVIYLMFNTKDVTFFFHFTHEILD